jgi:hypothetical protein
MLVLSIFAGAGIQNVVNALKRWRKLKFLVPLIYVSLLAWYFLPAFQGNLIHKAMRIDIPQRYFAMFDWLKSQPQTNKVAILPIHSIWNWVYYDWGYQGAGFLQFGIPQPILDRDYDRWSPYNEQYQREMTTAIYSRDAELLDSLMEKYNIGYVLVDEEVVAPGSKPNVFFFDHLEPTLSRSTSISLARDFGAGLKIYAVKPRSNDAVVYTPTQFADVTPTLLAGYHDQAFRDVGHYASTGDVNNSANYLVRDLLLNRLEQVDISQVTIESDRLVFNLGQLNKLEELSYGKNLYPTFISQYYDTILEEQSEIVARDDRLVVSTPITTQPVYLKNEPHRAPGCASKPGTRRSERVVQDDFVRFVAQSGVSCDFVSFPNLNHDTGHILFIEARFVEGLQTRVCISNSISRRCDIDSLLGKTRDWQTYTFMVPPLPDGHAGYDVHLSTLSTGNKISTTDIRSVHMIPIPYYWLQSLVTKPKTTSEVTSNNLELLDFAKLGQNIFKVALAQENSSESGLLVLNQGFEPGWHAYVIENSTSTVRNALNNLFPYLFGKALTNHVLVNNRANGWQLDDVQRSMFNVQRESETQSTSNFELRTIYIVFWPQLLEIIGLAMLPLPFLYVLTKKKLLSN